MAASVLPAISMSRRSSSAPNRSRTIRFNDSTPAPPVLTSVPSMSQSKRRFRIPPISVSRFVIRRAFRLRSRQAPSRNLHFFATGDVSTALDMTENSRGRIAPSPTGYLHVGHAATFWRAQERARAAGGELILRVEDIDAARCQPEFREALIEDLRWFGFRWKESPFLQSERRSFYLDAWKQLRDSGAIYPCTCSRKDVLSAGLAPHDENEEPIYPGPCRNRQLDFDSPAGVHWRFRIRDDEQLSFVDARLGLQTAIAGRDFGDFIVWRRDDVPAYQLAVVVDDAAMQISEVVRGADLIKSTARQLLLYRALGFAPPLWYHCPLVTDSAGNRLAKRHDALSLHALRQRGEKPANILTAPPDTLSPPSGIL